MNFENAKWIDVTDLYSKPQSPPKHTKDMCDWAMGCNNKIKFRVTLQDGHERYICKDHLHQRLMACGYTHKKVEELQKQ
ncbi:MAG: hypothetical protein WC365_07410 [Candidatus Babeliales bacterium]|jgi:hypothetical protein